MPAISLGKISVKISADISDIQRNMAAVNRKLQGTGGALQKNSKAWSAWSIKAAAANAAVVVAIGLTARKIIEYSNTYLSMINRLRLVTDGTDELAAATGKMFDISERSRTSVEATTVLYTRLWRATRELSISDERLLRVTESINKSFAISGANARETVGSIRQLSQALASGVLRGEEFNSISEQAPIILEAVRKATGKTSGELRELAQTGVITASLLIESMERYEKYIDTTFNKTIHTFSQKMLQASNNTMEFVGSNEDIANAVTVTGDAIRFLSENLDVMMESGKIVAKVVGVLMVGSLVNYVIALRVARAEALALAAANGALAVSAGVASRAVAVLRGLLGGWIGIAITAAIVMASFVDWTSKEEKAANAAAEGIKNLRDAMSKLSEVDLANTMKLAAKHQKALKAESKELLGRINSLQAAMDKDGGGSYGQAAMANLQKELQNVIKMYAVARKSADRMFGEGALDLFMQKKLDIIDISANELAKKMAKLNRKMVDAIIQDAKSEVKAEDDKYKAKQTALTMDFKIRMEEAVKNGEDVAALKAQQNALELDIEAKHLEALDKIKEDAAKKKAKAEEATPAEKETRKFLKDLANRFKGAEQLENERYAAETAKYIEAVGGKENLTEAHLARLREMEEEHKGLIAEIRDNDGFAQRMEERFATETELVAMKLEADLIQLEEHYALMKEKDQNYYDWKKALQDESANTQTAIAETANALELRRKLQMAQGMLNIAKGFGIKNKSVQRALFLTEKGIAIGRAVVATQLAAAQALASLPYPANLAAVAHVQLMGGLNIAAIAASAIGGMVSMNRGGGGGGAAKGGGGGGGGFRAASPGGGGGGPGNRHIDINLTGNAMFSADDVRALIEQINEQVGDGVTLKTGG